MEAGKPPVLTSWYHPTQRLNLESPSFEASKVTVIVEKNGVVVKSESHQVVV
jgi:hypothetical protein